MKTLQFFLLTLLLACLTACGNNQNEVIVTSHLDEPSPLAETWDGVVIPVNIAPVNLPAQGVGEEALVIMHQGEQLITKAHGGMFIPDLDAWKSLVKTSAGDTLRIEHCLQQKGQWVAYQPFRIVVAPEPIDTFLTYRLIPPGYEKWFAMSICQRNLTNFEETVVADNAQTGRNCMNCHSFCQQNASRMTMHVRGKNGGTLIAQDGKAVKIDPKTTAAHSSFVYPYWHPSGLFIAYSTNDTKQLFHTHDANRIEVMDLKSNVVVYDVERNEALICPLLTDTARFETFPCFSPDGHWLYFCSAAAPDSMPDDYNQVRYNLCRISFDAESRTFGSLIETVYDAAAEGYSASVPRISPDGRFLLYTRSQYGQFMIWHKDADLWMINLETGSNEPLAAANSLETDSYHTWSSNSHWIVFSSRRDDGLYTRPYIAYIDAEGHAHKAFRLPQSSPEYYDRLMFSYNVPELTVNAVPFSAAQLQ